MSYSRSFFLGVAFFIAFAIPSATAALACSGCCVQGSCCMATAGNCSFPNTCVCQSACGPGLGLCGCKCVGDTVIPRIPNFELSVTLSADYNLTLSGPGLPLGTVGTLIQNFSNWWVNVDSNVASVPVNFGHWEGTFEQSLKALAASAGVGCQINESSKTITLHSLN